MNKFPQSLLQPVKQSQTQAKVKLQRQPQAQRMAPQQPMFRDAGPGQMPDMMALAQRRQQGMPPQNPLAGDAQTRAAIQQAVQSAQNKPLLGGAIHGRQTQPQSFGQGSGAMPPGLGSTSRGLGAMPQGLGSMPQGMGASPGKPGMGSGFGGGAIGMKKGGPVRGDGACQRGKTKGRMR